MFSRFPFLCWISLYIRRSTVTSVTVTFHCCLPPVVEVSASALLSLQLSVLRQFFNMLLVHVSQKHPLVYAHAFHLKKKKKLKICVSHSLKNIIRTWVWLYFSLYLCWYCSLLFHRAKIPFFKKILFCVNFNNRLLDYDWAAEMLSYHN